MNPNMSIYMRLNPRLLVQCESSVGQDVRTEVTSVVEGIGRDIRGQDGHVERKRD